MTLAGPIFLEEIYLQDQKQHSTTFN